MGDKKCKKNDNIKVIAKKAIIKDIVRGEKMKEILIPKDEMTPFERMNAFGSGEVIDRIPCCPFTGESFANYFGYGLDEYNHSSEIIIDTITKTFELFRPDNCSIGPGLQGIPEAMGCELSFTKNDIPLVKTPAISDYSQIGKLKVSDPYKDGRLGLYLESLKTVKDRLDGQVCVGNTVGGVFSTAALTVGTEKFLKDLIKEKENIHKILEICYQSVINFMDAVMDIGITPGIADPIASSTLISPRMYREFVLPYTKACQDHIIKRMGGTGAMHICGKTKPIWKEMVETGISGLSLDNEDDIGELRAGFGDKVTIIGNVDPVSIIKYGSKNDIYGAVEECCKKSIGSPMGFVLASGCDIPIGTDPENIKHFIDAARIYGNLR